MFWRAWCFLAGLGPGALAVLAATRLVSNDPDAPGAAWVHAGALAGGALLLLAAHGLDRRPADEPDRGARFARAASVGLAAWPGLVAVFLGLPPGAVATFGLVALVLVAAFALATRRRAPAGRLGAQAVTAAAALLGGGVAFLLLGAAVAALGADEVVRTDANRRAVLDHDAGVDTVALPRCRPRAAAVRVLREAGAHPRRDASGRQLFFDAPGDDGRRQIHRLAMDGGEVDCLTCDEPGNNRHPAPNATGNAVMFDTDRHASWRRPRNTELQWLKTAAAVRGLASRRITYAPGPDERPIFTPARNTLAWSRGEGGRFRVVSGSLVSGHGSLQVGGLGTLRDGGAEWVAPLAWAPDARTLAFARGNPLGPARVDAFDPGDDGPVELGDTVSGAAGLDFNADGGWFVRASTRRAAPAGLLPDALGFALAPAVGTALADGAGWFQGTRVYWGATGGEPSEVELGELADWGWPTGVSLDPDGTGFVLGQRRASSANGSGPATERLVHVQLDCS